MVRTYTIYRVKSDGNHEKLAEITAGSGKSALNQFKKRLTASGM